MFFYSLMSFTWTNWLISFNPVWRDFCFSTMIEKYDPETGETVSIPPGGIFVFLPEFGSNSWELDALVSIPSGGIFVFLHFYRTVIDFELYCFNPVWRDFCFSTFLNTLGGGVLYASFNPVWRDFCFSTDTIVITQDGDLQVSIPSGGIFVFLPYHFQVKGTDLENKFQSRLAGFLFFY